MSDAEVRRGLEQAGRIFARALERRLGGTWRPILRDPATGDTGNTLPRELDRIVKPEDVDAVDQGIVAGEDHHAADDAS